MKMERARRGERRKKQVVKSAFGENDSLTLFILTCITCIT